MPSPSSLTGTSKLNLWEGHWEQYGMHRFASERCDLSLEKSSEYCRKLANQYYENFSVASLLIPPELRSHFFHVYAYCRWSDNLADEAPSSALATQRLDWWQNELDDCFSGSPNHPVMIALRHTVVHFDLPQEPFNDLLSAFRQDQTVNRYADDSELMDYCRRSANPVGRILLAMANVTDAEAIRFSDQICSGLQLANFCQDMKRDADINRIYLPRSRWDDFGIDEAMILKGTATPELCATVAIWIEDIVPMFMEGWNLAERVPKWLARDICLFAGGGLAILENIAKANCDVWSTRIEVNKRTKFGLLVRALLTKRRPATDWLVSLRMIQAQGGKSKGIAYVE